MKVSGKTHTIYVLIHNQTVYVGKTTGKLDAVYYRHCRAENPYTAEYYYPKNSKNPSLHILKKVTCSSSECDPYIAAWIHIFQNAGCRVINPQGELENANDLTSDIKSLIRVLRPASLNTFLKENQYGKQKKNTKTTRFSANKEKKEKITLWATPEDKERFVAYAKSLGFTQSETLQYLIRKVELGKEDPLFPNWIDDSFTRNREEMYRRKFEAMEHGIHQLKAKIHSNNAAMKTESKKTMQCHVMAQEALVDYYSFFTSAAMIPLVAERGKYKEYVRNLPKDVIYTYPDGSGSALLRLQAFLYGEGAARFILGADQRGHYIKVRYYDGRYFLGISPGNQRFSQRNSVWYVKWKMSDGVADLVASFPMQIKARYNNPMDEQEKLDRFVDRLMAEADEDNDF